jgi:hypothetical protein
MNNKPNRFRSLIIDGPLIYFPKDPWEKIRESDESMHKRDILQSSQIIESGRFISHALLMSLMGPKERLNDAITKLLPIAWKLPLSTLDSILHIVEGFYSLRECDVFVFNPRNKPEVHVEYGVVNISNFIKSNPEARRPTQAEIDQYLLWAAANSIFE